MQGYPGSFRGQKPAPISGIQSHCGAQVADAGQRNCLEDLRVPPGNRLEALHGDRKGQLSIRINESGAYASDLKDGNAFDVEMVDYH